LYILYEKIDNTFNNEKYLFKKLKEIKDASLEFDSQTRLINLWHKAGGQNFQIRKKTNYGPKRIKLELAKKHMKASEHRIYKVLLKYELIQKHKKHKKKPKKYYVPSPGYPYRFYQYTAIDSYTRMRVIRVYDELSAFNSVRFLKEVVKQLPFRILAVRTDNGVEITYGPFKKEHPFSLECVRLNIKHYLNKPSHPESNGRVQRPIELMRKNSTELIRLNHQENGCIK